MSDPQSAASDGMAKGTVQVQELDRQGMVTLRGDLSASALQDAVKAATGQDIPTQRGILGGFGAGVAWMSPDELMLFCDAEKASALAELLDQALSTSHHLVVDVSDARTAFALEGQDVRGVIAKLAPVDMAPGQFEPGEIRRTRLAQIPAAFWMPDRETLHVLCFRSVARYAFDVLRHAADTPLGIKGWSTDQA